MAIIHVCTSKMSLIGRKIRTELTIVQSKISKPSRFRYHIFPPSKPPWPMIAADVFASRNSSFISPISSTSICVRPARFASIEAGVSSCNAYLRTKEKLSDVNGDIAKTLNLKEDFSPSAASRSRTPLPSFSPSTMERRWTTLPTCSRVYFSVFTIMHLCGQEFQGTSPARKNSNNHRSSKSTGMP